MTLTQSYTELESSFPLLINVMKPHRTRWEFNKRDLDICKNGDNFKFQDSLQWLNNFLRGEGLEGLETEIVCDSIVIAIHNGSDYLFIDGKDSSIKCFYQDGNEVITLFKSIEDLEKSFDQTFIQTKKENITLDGLENGWWKVTEAGKHSPQVIQSMSKYQFLGNGTCIEHDMFDDKTETKWSIRKNPKEDLLIVIARPKEDRILKVESLRGNSLEVLDQTHLKIKFERA